MGRLAIDLAKLNGHDGSRKTGRRAMAAEILTGKIRGRVVIDL
jgi:hypothetical protein